MTSGELHVVTGAFGYTGRYIARWLVSQGRRVRTLTNHPDPGDPLAGLVEVAPLDFGDPPELSRNMRGARTLYNTYWIRFPHGQTTFSGAIENTRVLIRAAKEAGVRRVVHVSVTNASADSPLPYFRGKAVLEGVVAGSGLSYAILRPTVIFGLGDVLLNNIAWLLRRFPFFALFGSGDYLLQPIYAGDLAELAGEEGVAEDNRVVDAVGPETYTFEALVRHVRNAIGSRARILRLPPPAAFLLVRLLSLLVRDVLLTREEIKGLMANLLVSDGPPTGRTSLRAWLEENATGLGRRYASELDRHFRR